MPELGRPSKLTPDVQNKVVQALQLGAQRQDAATYAGVDAATLRRWLRKGITEPESEYGRFRAAVIEAESRAKVAAMGVITKAARDGDWKAAAWMLARKYPHQFAERSQLFTIAKTFEQIEAAAEAAGAPLPDDVLQRAWMNLAGDLADRFHGVPGLPGGLDLSEAEQELDDSNLTEEQRDALLALLREERKQPRVIDVVPVNGDT